MNKKWIIAAAIILLLCMAVYVTSAPKKQVSAKPVVKIGVSLPLTGNIAYAGQGMKASLDVFQEELAKKNLKHNYQFIFEDNAFNSKNIVSVTHKLLDLDKVDAILDFGSIVGQISSPLSAKSGIVHFNACASDEKIADGNDNFLLTTLPDDEAQLLSSKIKGKYNRIAVIGQNDVSSQVTVDAVKKSFDENKIKYSTFFVNQDEKDMRLLLQKINAQNPDLYVVILYSPTLEIFMKQKHEQGISEPVTSTHFFANTSDYRLLEGAKFADYAVMEKDLKARVKAKNRHNDYEMCIGYMYDATDMLVSAFENSNSKNEASEYLRSIKEFHGVTGPVSQKAPGVFTIVPSYKEIINGKPVLIE